MPILHRIQWIDAQIRSGRYPNARSLAAAFEISRRQALRDFEYLRDSLGAPLEYSAVHRGYIYTTDSFTPPGAYVTESERTVLESMAAYYSDVAATDTVAAPVYEQLADLLSRVVGGRHVPTSREQALPPAWTGLRPFRARLRQESPSTVVPAALRCYARGEPAPGVFACEFADTDRFLADVLAAGPVYRVDWPGWLRERLQARLTKFQLANAGMTRSVTPPAVLSTQEPAKAAGHMFRRDQPVTGTRKETTARFKGSWLSYIGAAYGACQAAGLCDLDFIDAYGMSGMGSHLIVHDTCHPGAVTWYPWLYDHAAALDRLGVLSEVYLSFPGSRTYEAACRRAVTNIKASIDRGVAAVLWGVDTGEFGVVYGYDDTDGVLLVSGVYGQGPEGSVPILYENVGRTFEGAPILHYQIPLERVPVDRDQVYRASLAEYVSWMQRPIHTDPSYHCGLAAYDVWIKALSRPDLNQYGMRYLVYVYYETKDFMAAYVRRLAETWQGAPGLTEIAESFRTVSTVYDRMMEVLEQTWEPPPILNQPVTPEQLRALDTLLRDARAKEAATVALVNRALAQRPN